MKLAKKTLFALLIVCGLLASVSLGFEIYRAIVREEATTIYLAQRILNICILPIYIAMCLYISIFIYNKEHRIPPLVYLIMGILYFVGAIAMLFTTTNGVFVMAFSTLTTAFFGLPCGFMSITMYDKTRFKV